MTSPNNTPNCDHPLQNPSSPTPPQKKGETSPHKIPHRHHHPSKNPLLFLLLLVTNFSSTSSFCPSYCACDDIALSVNCHSTSNLMVVPIFLNPQIKSLSLKNNQIKDITLSLQFYGELQTLDLSQNALESLGKQNFEVLKGLRSLNVSYNGIKALEAGVFFGLGQVESIDLSGNQLERIEREIFWSLRKIREINLDRNRLEFLDWDLFRGLDSLQTVTARFNFVKVVEPSPSWGEGAIKAPWTLPSLHTLDISSNQLTRMKNASLLVFSSLSDLNLCCNYIHTIEEGAFTAVRSLKKLNLSQNRLGKVPTGALERVSPSLTQLDISSNRLGDGITRTDFSGLLSLELLSITDNPRLTFVEPGALIENMNLVRFFADYLSNLTTLPPSLLEGKPRLELFSVRYASISSLEWDHLLTGKGLHDLSGRKAIRALDLTGNPIECNCSVYSLFEYLSSETESFDPGTLELARSTGFGEVMRSEFGILRLSNLSQAKYINPNSPSLVPQNSSKNPKIFHLFNTRCSSPPHLSALLVKDLKGSDFDECFVAHDHFQLLVISIAGALIILIVFVIGVRLCCFGERRGCAWLKKRFANKPGEIKCCCNFRSKTSDKGDKQYFDSVMISHLPPNLVQGNSSFINGGLTLSNGMIALNNAPTGLSNGQICMNNGVLTLGNYGTGMTLSNGGGITLANGMTLPLGNPCSSSTNVSNKALYQDTNSPARSNSYYSTNKPSNNTTPAFGQMIMEYNNSKGEDRYDDEDDDNDCDDDDDDNDNDHRYPHRPLNNFQLSHNNPYQHHPQNTLGKKPYPTQQQQHLNYTPQPHFLLQQQSYPQQQQPPPLPTTNPPPVILHYEYQYQDYPGSSSNNAHSHSSHSSGGSGTSARVSHPRVKQVPSVLV